jgi:transposase
MNAYSEDLRNKIVEALRRGMTKSEATRTPKKRPGSKPKLDERARRLLEADAEERPSATLSERGEYLRKAAGVWVSDSTLSRMLRRLGWSRKKDYWQRESATSS